MWGEGKKYFHQGQNHAWGGPGRRGWAENPIIYKTMTYFGVCPSMSVCFSSGADLEGTYAPPPSRFYSLGRICPLCPRENMPPMPKCWTRLWLYNTNYIKLTKISAVNPNAKRIFSVICQCLFFPYCNSYIKLFTIAPQSVIALYLFANFIVFAVLLPKCLSFFKL